jgi:hypothetical protein
MFRIVTMKLIAEMIDEMPEDLQAQHVEVDLQPRRVLRPRQVRVGEPPRVRQLRPQEEAEVDEDPAEEVDPEGERVEPREGDVARPDLQRDHVVEERGGQRHQRQEHHGHRVHGEHLVVELGRDERVVRHDQLSPDQQRLDPPDQEEEEGGPEVEDADPLVVDRGDPAPQPGVGRARGVGRRVMVDVAAMMSSKASEGMPLSCSVCRYSCRDRCSVAPGSASARRA